jgi:hypothetical protein
VTFDIARFDTRTRAEAGAEMVILRPAPPYAPFLDDDKKPLSLSLKGRNSTAYKAIQRELQMRNADRSARDITRTDEDEQRDRFDVLVAVTAGWSFDQMDGQPFAFSPENVRKLWADNRWDWLQTQALNFVNAEGNFLAP